MSPRARTTLILILLAVSAVCVRLGFWQRGRLLERRTANAQAAAARELSMVVLPASGPLAGRKVTATGHYDLTHDILIRGQVFREVPGVHVVTPLLLEGSDSAVLVNRGWLPTPDAAFAPTDSIRETGTVRVAGRAVALQSRADSGVPLVRRDQLTVARPDLALLRRRLPYPILDVMVVQEPDSARAGYPRRLEPPPFDDGSHRNYMIQWFAFAAMALAGAAVIAKAR
jgi:surfeit locus 1 family protein